MKTTDTDAVDSAFVKSVLTLQYEGASTIPERLVGRQKYLASKRTVSPTISSS